MEECGNGSTKTGTAELLFHRQPVIRAWASVAGKKESEGPLQPYFDYTNQDTYFGEATWGKGGVPDAATGLGNPAAKGGTAGGGH